MSKLGDRMYHKRLRDFESFDSIELAVVPRYKTSGLSGDEWRQHVAVRFYFKGELVHEAGFNSMRGAILMLGHTWVTAQEPIPERVIELERHTCDQPSCPNTAEGRFLLKRETAEDGQYLNETHLARYRKFCKRHLKRGDCSREDADDNYTPLDAAGPDQSINLEESPAAFGGIVSAEDLGIAIPTGEKPS